ncbi:MAG TPA: thiamine phosphate synthase [Gemmatimonadota bacterium]|nr:thiamine phosphate synthase [Gemmatimonadota bacterium]
MLDRTHPTLCFVHDAVSADPPEGLWRLPDEVWGDVDLVQLRGKNLDDGELETLARGWVTRVAGLDTVVIVNDRLEVALSAGAHGVHLGDEDASIEAARERTPEGFLIGGSCHSRNGLLIAQAAGVDYAGLGAFFESSTKPDARPLDPWRGGLMERIPALTVPVLAISGVTAARIEEVFRVPAVTGAAVSAAIQGSEDPAAAVGGLRKALHEAWDARLTVADR